MNILIEAHEEDGVHWGVSFDGFNPTADKFVRCFDKGEAVKLHSILNEY